VQFGVTQALTGDFVRHDEPKPERPEIGVVWYALEYT
jgi:catechol 1,2-dioxygenase